MLTVYSKLNCPFCEQAKAYLSSKGIDFQVVRIDEVTEAREFLMTEGHRSVPQIYNGDELFVEGGYQGLVRLSEDELNEKIGELDVG